MSAYEENFKEKEAQEKYERRETIFAFLVASFISISVLWYALPANESIVFWFFGVPNSRAAGFYIAGFLFLLLARWWWKGFPGFFRKIKAPAFLKKVPLISLLIPKAAYNGIPERILRGRRAEIHDFLYQEVEKSDFLERVDRFYFFRGKLTSKEINPRNFFDYDPDKEILDFYSRKEDLELRKKPVKTKEEAQKIRSIIERNRLKGTTRIILAFRDRKREVYVKRASSSNKKFAEKWRKILRNYDKKYRDRKVPSPSQLKEYEDLFKIMEGVLQGYTHEIDGEIVSRIYKKRIGSPLRMKMEEDGSRIVGAKIDTARDVYHKGKVYFSPEMIISTVNRMTYLFWRYFKRMSSRQGPIARRTTRGGVNYHDIECRAKVLDIFKLMLFRRFMLSYGSMPSSWFCVHINDYDYRAIVSSIDRPMIPVITSVNDGSNEFYSSDVFAEGFLLLWWGFFKNSEIENLIEELDWAFNTTKDVNEISMREYAKKMGSFSSAGSNDD